jgi:hypothetical protein
MITAFTEGSASAAASSGTSSPESANESALTGGLSSVISRTPSPRSDVFTRWGVVVLLMVLSRA